MPTQDILINPNSSGDPTITFIGSGLNATPITLKVLSNYQSASGSGSAIVFDGSDGRLFSITDNLSSGIIFNVGNSSGLSLLNASAVGDVKIAEFGRFVGVGYGTPLYTLDVFGTGNFRQPVIFNSGVSVTGTLSVNGTGVSVSGHTHTASQITDFNEAVDDRIGSGLFVAGTGIRLFYNDTANSFNVSVSGLINNPTNNRVLTSRDNTSTGIDAESDLTFENKTLNIGSSGNAGAEAIINLYTNDGGDGQPAINFKDYDDNTKLKLYWNDDDNTSYVYSLNDSLVLSGPTNYIGINNDGTIGIVSSGVTSNNNFGITNQTANTIASFDGSKNVTSLSTGTYPSLTELSYVKGVTSAIQTQLNAKQATITGGATTITDSNLTVSRALVSDGSGKVAVSTTTAAELAHVSGVTSSIQTQINSKQNTLTNPVIGTGAANHIAYWTSSSGLAHDANQLFWDATNNRLGLGTGSPTYGLHLVGSGYVNGLLDVDNLRLDANTISSTNNNGNIIISPTGNGALQVSSGGNSRGTNAIDLQKERFGSDSAVAGGEYSNILGGYSNTISNNGTSSSILGGPYNSIFNSYSATIGTFNRSAGSDNFNIGSSNTCFKSSNYIIGEGNKVAAANSTAIGSANFIGAPSGYLEYYVLSVDSNIIYLDGSYSSVFTSGTPITIYGSVTAGSNFVNYTVNSVSENSDNTITALVVNSGVNPLYTDGDGVIKNNTSNIGAYSIAIGSYASCTHQGELGFANGTFTYPGEAQHSTLIAKIITTSNTANTVLTLDGSSAISTNRLTIQPRTAWTFNIKLSAYNTTDNQSGWWIFRGGIRRNAANSTVLVGSIITENGVESSLSTASASVVADDTNEALEIRVTGVSGKNIRWVAVVELTQCGIFS